MSAIDLEKKVTPLIIAITRGSSWYKIMKIKLFWVWQVDHNFFIESALTFALIINLLSIIRLLTPAMFFLGVLLVPLEFLWGYVLFKRITKRWRKAELLRNPLVQSAIASLESCELLPSDAENAVLSICEELPIDYYEPLLRSISLCSRPTSEQIHSHSTNVFIRARQLELGYIGDYSCLNNARSPYLQCAINPSGKCSECKDYKKE